MDGRTGRGYEYKVCWEKTWLLESELENARELLRQFESKRQAQRGGKRGDWHVQIRTGKILGHVVPALLFVPCLGETRRNIGGRRKLTEMLHVIGMARSENQSPLCPHDIRRNISRPALRGVCFTPFLRRNSQSVLVAPITFCFARTGLSFAFLLPFSTVSKPSLVVFSI